MPKVSQSYRDGRRNEILDSAWACFARSGYHDTTMQDIFEECGLSAGAVYRYFGSKEDILLAINERSTELGRRLVRDALAQTGGELGSLQIIGRVMLGAFAHPMFESMARVNIELWPEVVRNERLREGTQAEASFWLTAVTDILTDAKARGQLRPDVEPEVAAVLFMSAYEGLRHMALILPERFTPVALLRLGEILAPNLHVPDADEFLRSISNEGPPLGTHLARKRTLPDTPGQARKDGATARARKRRGVGQ